jgi:hypothetical protein
MSIDYSKSGRLAVNVLIDLYNVRLKSKFKIDFINIEIQPERAKTERSNQLIKDYLNWLPKHFVSHNYDLAKLEILTIEVLVDFDRAFVPTRMNDALQFDVIAKTTWKAKGRNKEIMELKETELIKKEFLKLGIPESK